MNYQIKLTLVQLANIDAVLRALHNLLLGMYDWTHTVIDNELCIDTQMRGIGADIQDIINMW